MAGAVAPGYLPRWQPPTQAARLGDGLQQACLPASRIGAGRHGDCHFQAVIYCLELGSDIYRDWHVVGDPLLGVGDGRLASLVWHFPLTVTFLHSGFCREGLWKKHLTSIVWDSLCSLARALLEREPERDAAGIY